MYVRVVVEPGSKRERVTKISDTEFQVSVREPRERNMANTRIRELIAREFGVPVTRVRLLTGHRSSSKILSIEV